MLPSLRTKLKNVSSKNKSLQDLLRTSAVAEEVVSVEKHEHGIHNTQIVLKLPNGEKRVQFYNRLKIDTVIPEGFLSSGNITLDIETLNGLYGCDFTTDDIQLSGGKIVSVPTSLGYYDETDVKPSGFKGDTTTIILNPMSEFRPDYSHANIIVKLTNKTKNETRFWYSDVINVGSSKNVSDRVCDLIKTFLEDPEAKILFGYTIVETDFSDYGTTHVKGGKIIRIKNLTGDVYELTIALRVYGPTELNVYEGRATYTIPYLTNTRLLPKDASIAGVFEDDVHVIRVRDFKNRNYLKDWIAPGTDPESYIGTDIHFNNGEENSWVRRPFETSDLLVNANPMEARLMNRETGLGYQVRLFVEPFRPDEISDLSADRVVGIIKNVSDDPIIFNWVGLNKPIELAPNKNLDRPDEFLFGSFGSFNFGASIDPEKTFKLSIEFPDSDRESIDFLTNKNIEGGFASVIKELATQAHDVLDMAILIEPQSLTKYFYFKNKLSDKILIFMIQDTPSRELIFNFKLDAKGTFGMDYSNLPELNADVIKNLLDEEGGDEDETNPAAYFKDSRILTSAEISTIETMNRLGITFNKIYEDDKEWEQMEDILWNNSINPAIFELKNTDGQDGKYVVKSNPMIQPGEFSV